MSCVQVNTLEAASEKISSSVLPISGLRRDSDGNLTTDALNIIVDGLKSRGIDPTDKDQNKQMRKELSVFLCSLNNQYQFLMKELINRLDQNETIPTTFIDIIKEKNIAMQDVINTSGYLNGILKSSEKVFIEGWQNTRSSYYLTGNYDLDGGFTTTELTNHRNALDSKSYVELRKHMVEVTGEKNRVASNYLGMYGFLNLVAIGLLIYLAGAPK